MNKKVILVDSNDVAIGSAAKEDAHRKGLLHRAFSIFLLNSRGEILLQRRAKDKYHSGGLWTNSCCSHPQPDESTAVAAVERLHEEMGIRCDLEEIYSFQYQVNVSNGYIEHEIDHVFLGRFDGVPIPNQAEVEDWKWVDWHTLIEDVANHPDRYSYWLRVCLENPQLRAALQV